MSQKFRENPIFSHAEADFSGKILNVEHYFRMPEIFPALLLLEYWSAFSSGMTVLSQMPPFLRFDLRLFSEDKVMQNEIIHRYFLTSPFTRGIILGGGYLKINGIVEALGALCTSSSVKV